MRIETTSEQTFALFVEMNESAIRRAFIAQFGPELGRDAAAEALLYGLEHWDRVAALENPAGYLFRVGQRWGRRQRSRRVRFDVPELSTSPWFEPGLPVALAGLPDKQRVAVVLRHGADMTYREIAALTDQSEETVRKQVERALVALRQALGGDR